MDEFFTMARRQLSEDLGGMSQEIARVPCLLLIARR